MNKTTYKDSTKEMFVSWHKTGRWIRKKTGWEVRKRGFGLNGTRTEKVSCRKLQGRSAGREFDFYGKNGLKMKETNQKGEKEGLEVSWYESGQKKQN